MNDMSVLQSAASSEERSTTTRRSRSSSCRPRASTRSISPSPRRCPSSSTSARLPIHPPLARCLRPRTVNLSPHRPPHPTASNHNELNRTNVEFDRWRRWRASVVVRKRSVNNERTSSANASRSRRTCPKPSCKSTSTPGARLPWYHATPRAHSLSLATARTQIERSGTDSQALEARAAVAASLGAGDRGDCKVRPNRRSDRGR